MGFFIRLSALSCMSLLVACATLGPLPLLPLETAAPAGDDTRLDRLLAAKEAEHPEESAFRLLPDGPEAFVVRAQSARLAQRSIDVQTYIWHGDTTGLYLAQQLLDAADRGVKVRLLVDDMDARARNAGFAALAAHANIAVRMFNPFASRSGTLAFLSEGMRSFSRINHRMHNKTWIADNRLAVAGGRNLGDEYFGASTEVNFVDLDFAMAGPVVRDASASFDRYWNSPASYPMSVLDPARVDPAKLAELRRKLRASIDPQAVKRYTDTLRADTAVRQLASGDWPMQWSAHYTFASDDPLKAMLDHNDPQRSHVLALVRPALEAAQHQANLISPYFVPGKQGTAGLVSAAQSGRQMRILTNSLSANDVATVHGGYSRYRKALLEGGVQLWELKPLPGRRQESSLFGSQGASLHTKAFAVDGRSLFVGSYNLDPRSTWLNCEQGTLVESPALARQFDDIFASQTSGEHAWRVTLERQKPHWTDGTEAFDADPEASVAKRFQAWLARVLHLDSQL